MESTFATFATVIKVLEDSVLEFKEHSIKIWIQRPGPNYLDRLGKIEAVGWRFGLPMEVYGPETHITAVVPVALELQPKLAEADSAVSLFISAIVVKKNTKEPVAQAAPAGDHTIVTASAQTTSIVYGLNVRIGQNVQAQDAIHVC